MALLLFLLLLLMLLLVLRCHIRAYHCECLCSVGVYLPGDALLHEDESHLSSASSLPPLQTATQVPLFISGTPMALPSYESLARLVSRSSTTEALQELRVQEKFWDRVFSRRLVQLGLGSGNAESEMEQDVRTPRAYFVSSFGFSFCLVSNHEGVEC